jgi:amino acid efflux transporter
MSGLKKNLGFYQGLALYLAAVLGTGILVVPLMAWTEGGPASLIAWAALGILGLALAWTFASIGAQEPNAGGVQAMIGRVFGPKIETISRYLIFFSVPAGAVAASHILAYHLCAAFALPIWYLPVFAYGSWVLITFANYCGIQVSANVQLFLSFLLVVFLLFFVIAAAPLIKLDNFTPFLPHGFRGIGNSALIIFWSFLGWEAIAHLAEEFKDPERDMLRASIVAAVLVGVLYLAVSFVLIGSGAVFDSSQMAPLVVFAGQTLGPWGRVFIGVVAAVICFSTMNAYMAGLSRLGYSMARDGDLPKFIAKIDPDGTPRNSILVQLCLNTTALSIQWFFKIGLKTFFLVPNLSFLILYFLGSLAAAHLLRGRRLAMFSAYFSAFACLVMIPFAAGVWIIPAAIAALGAVKVLCSEPSKQAIHRSKMRVGSK